MKRISTTGMERRVPHSKARHPEFQAMNGLSMNPKPIPPASSWWTEAKTREDFKRQQATEQARMSRVALSTPHKDAI